MRKNNSSRKLCRFSYVKLVVLVLLAFYSILADARQWTLVWSDEFIDTYLDTTKWSFDIGTGAPLLTGWGNNELEYYTSRSKNARIKNGKLIIEAHKEAYQNSAYTSSRIKTMGKGDWTYGRFEIRAKVPSGKGVWPAIWMLPTENHYGGWAASGEIDIMEVLGHEPATVHGTIHFGGQWPDNKSKGTSYALSDGNFSNTFHTFTLEWNSTGLSWYVDSTCYQKLDHGQPFDRPFYILLNVAIGGNWPGNPDAQTTFPAVMEIDYVRVYQVNTSIVIKPIPRKVYPVCDIQRPVDFLGRQNTTVIQSILPVIQRDGLCIFPEMKYSY